MSRARAIAAAASLAAATCLAAAPAWAAGPLEGPVVRQTTDYTAIAMFLACVVLTLGITYWAARRTRTAEDFYAAGGSITGFQNGRRDRRRLHVGRLLPRHLGAGVLERL